MGKKGRVMSKFGYVVYYGTFNTCKYSLIESCCSNLGYL